MRAEVYFPYILSLNKLIPDFSFVYLSQSGRQLLDYNL